jgi:crinkler effector protein
MTTELKLFVYVIGLNSSSFSVTLQNSKTVDDLKDAVLIKKSNDLKGIDADRLTLFKVALPDGKTLEQSAPQSLQHELDVPSCPLSEEFEIQPKGRQ